MCVYSAMGPAYEPLIPHPIPTVPNAPVPMPQKCNAPGICFCPTCLAKNGWQFQWPWGPVPSTGLPITPEDLRILLDAFHKAVEAAKAADKAAGQPDCTDPDKVKLEGRVAELERRLEAGARP